MTNFYPDSPEFRETKYHQKQLHPVRFQFFKAKMRVKEQDRLKDYFSEKLNISVRVKREDGYSIFLCSKYKKLEAMKYCFENYSEISNSFQFDEIFIDVVELQENKML